MPLLIKLNLENAANPVAGWTSRNIAADFFNGFSSIYVYPDPIDYNGQSNVAPEAVYRSVAYQSSGNAATAATLSGLTAGISYICRLHVWMPVGFETNVTQIWQASVGGGTAKTVTASPGKVVVVDIPFTASGATAVLNYSLNSAGAYKVTSAIEIIETVAVVPPGIPPNLTVTPASSSALNISWGGSAPGTNPAAGYKIRLTGGGNNGFVADAGNTLTYQFGSLLPETEYSIEVAAYDAAGAQSAWSAVVRARTLEYVPEQFRALYDGVKFLRARYYKYPSDWEKVQAMHTYQDGGVSFNELNDSAPVKWEIGFTGMSVADANLFEAHFDYFRQSRPFDFTDKYGAVHRVYYADFNRSHEANVWRIQAIKAVLIEYPSATNEKLTTDAGEFLTI